MGKHYVYKTLDGDNFDSIALDFYNNEFYASKVIEANPQYAEVLTFNEGIELKIPVVEIVNSEALPPWKRG